MFVLFLLAIVLYVLQRMVSDYPFDIFNLLLAVFKIRIISFTQFLVF